MAVDIKQLIKAALATAQTPLSAQQIADEIERISGHPVNLRLVNSHLEGHGMRADVRAEGRLWVLISPPASVVHEERLYWCRFGEHEFTSATKHSAGASCDMHAIEPIPEESSTARDDGSSFFWNGLWYLRLCVTDDLLGVSETHIPRAIGEKLPVRDGVLMPLRPSSAHAALPEIVIRKAGSAHWARGVGDLVRVLDCRPGDLLFIGLRSMEYTVFVRPRPSAEELSDAGLHLAWLLGGECVPEQVAPWEYLSETIGCQRANRRAFRERLVERAQLGCVDLLDGIPLRTPGQEDWPFLWHLVCPLGDGPGLRLVGGSALSRLAVAFCRGMDVPCEHVASPGGILWVEKSSPTLASDDRDPCGLPHASQLIDPRSELSRWLRAEHNARLAGLTGYCWRIACEARGWVRDGAVYPRLVEALESIELIDAPASAGSLAGLGHSIAYPRNQWALESLESELRGRTVSLASDESGFSAEFQDGSRKQAISLIRLR